jgi:hypothetical protein
MTTNTPTPLNRQELRKFVAKAIENSEWDFNGYLPIADAAIKAFEEFNARNKPIENLPINPR